MGPRPTRADAFERALAHARDVVAGDVSGDIPVFNVAWRIRSELAQFGWKGPRFQQLVLSDKQFGAVTGFLRCWPASGPEATAEIEGECRALLAGD